MVEPPLLHGLSPTLLLVLNLVGTFVFGLSGGMAGVRAKLDVFGGVVLGIVVGITGGMIRDILIRQVPTVLRGGLYAIPALIGAGIVVVAYRLGDHTVIFPILGATICFATRMAGLHYGLGLPAADSLALRPVGGATVCRTTESPGRAGCGVGRGARCGRRPRTPRGVLGGWGRCRRRRAGGCTGPALFLHRDARAT